MPDDPIIRSRSNPLLKRLRALKRRSGREPGLLLEGHRLLGEALAAELELVEVAVTPDVAEQQPALLAELVRRRVPLHRVEAGLLASLSELDTAPGLLALARRPAPRDPRALSQDALLLVADGVQNPGNLGALIRTAEAAGAEAVLLGPGCADPWSWKSLRGAMGSAFRLPIESFAGYPALLERIRAGGARLFAADVRADTPWDAADYRGPLALAVGGEGAALDAALLEAADRRIGIPMRPGVESLNVSVAAGVLLYEAARQRRAGEAPELSRSGLRQIL